MEFVKYIIEFLFGTALFINSILFIPQAVKIIKTESTEGVSLLTFLGFLLIQFAIVLHGLINQDYLLISGYLLSMITCGTVVSLIFYYNKRGKAINIGLESILEQSPGHIYWKNKEGVLLGCNAQTWKDFGLNSLADYKGKTDYDLLPTDQADQLWRIDQEVIRTGNPKIIEEESTVTDNTVKVYLSHKFPLRDHFQQIIGIVGVSLDITEAKKTTIERFEMLENIISLMPGHVYWVNKEGVYLGCNDNQARSAGLSSRKEIVGKRNRDLPWNFNSGVLPETLDKINKEVMESGKVITVEEPAILQNGTEAIFLSNKVPIRNGHGEIIGMVGISIEITDRKKIEQELVQAKNKAESANIAKTKFLENMRHDLRTPLSGIIGMAEALENEDNIEKARKHAAGLAKSSKELLNFLNEILETINVASGEIPLVKKKFNLKNILENVIALHQPKAEEKGLKLELSFDNNIPAYLIGDSIRIYRIILELLVNALKFTKKGYVKISTKLAKKFERDAVVKIEVEDTGPGIPLEKQQELFLRFNRLTPSYQGIYKGTGLGLSIVKQFIDDLQAEIYYDAENQNGAKFVCLISVKEALLEDNLGEDTFSFKHSLPYNREERGKIENKNAVIHTKFTQKTEVLIVEDQEIAASIAKDLFENLRCKVDIASDGETAIRLSKQQRYDLILMDIGLPDLDGYEVTKYIRSHEVPSQHRTPIIGLTAHVDKEKKQLGIDAGMNIVLTKPLLQENAMDILRNFVFKQPLDDKQFINEETIDIVSL